MDSASCLWLWNWLSPRSSQRARAMSSTQFLISDRFFAGPWGAWHHDQQWKRYCAKTQIHDEQRRGNEQHYKLATVCMSSLLHGHFQRLPGRVAQFRGCSLYVMRMYLSIPTHDDWQETFSVVLALLNTSLTTVQPLFKQERLHQFRPT